MEKRREEREAAALRVSGISIAANLALSAFKLSAGLIGHSTALISDAVHSASDVFSTIIVIIGVKLSGREADREHPYGHERFESLASLFLAFVLGVTGLSIGVNSAQQIHSGEYGVTAFPGMLALAAALISIAVKEWLFQYTKRVSVKTGSSVLMADAWHHRSDALSSIGSFAGILGARLGFPVCDSLAGIIICVFILKTALDIFRDSSGKLTDRSCDPETLSGMDRLIREQPGVKNLDLLQTRQFGSGIFVDIEISADADLPLREAHEIAETVDRRIEEQFKNVKHCMVHVNPA